MPGRDVVPTRWICRLARILEHSLRRQGGVSPAKHAKEERQGAYLLVASGPYWTNAQTYNWTSLEREAALEVTHEAVRSLDAPFIALDLAQTEAGNGICSCKESTRESPRFASASVLAFVRRAGAEERLGSTHFDSHSDDIEPLKQRLVEVERANKQLSSATSTSRASSPSSLSDARVVAASKSRTASCCWSSRMSSPRKRPRNSMTRSPTPTHSQLSPLDHREPRRRSVVAVLCRTRPRLERTGHPP